MPKKRSSKIWTTARADKEFSKWIRARDGRCLRCGTTEKLSCSHFWPRNKSATRYNPDNCITLCLWKCHIYGWEKDKQGEYTDFMLKRLGFEKYIELRQLYYQSKMSRAQSIKELMSWLSTS